jgi:transcriptional regulator with XRE-family HTH domain
LSRVSGWETNSSGRQTDWYRQRLPEEARLTLEAEFAERIGAADYTISKVRQGLDTAQRSVTALRDLVAAERNVTYSERQNVLAMQSQLAAVEEEALALRARLAAILSSHLICLLSLRKRHFLV